jgi:hypothetical protein
VNPWRHLRLLFLEERSKLIAPIHVVRMRSLQRHELLMCRGCIAPKLGQEINNSALLGDLPFRDIQLTNSLNEIVHDSVSIHSHQPPDSGEMVVESYGRTACGAEFFCALRGQPCVGGGVDRTTVNCPNASQSTPSTAHARSQSTRRGGSIRH